MTREGEVADFAGEGVGAGDRKMDNAFVHGGERRCIVGWYAENDRHYDIEAGDDKSGILVDGAGGSGIDLVDFGRRGVAGRDIGDDWGDKIAVILHKKEEENEAGGDDEREEMFAFADFLGFFGSLFFDFIVEFLLFGHFFLENLGFDALGFFFTEISGGVSVILVVILLVIIAPGGMKIVPVLRVFGGVPCASGVGWEFVFSEVGIFIGTQNVLARQFGSGDALFFAVVLVLPTRGRIHIKYYSIDFGWWHWKCFVLGEYWFCCRVEKSALGGGAIL